jgi:hypothetical protein
MRNLDNLVVSAPASPTNPVPCAQFQIALITVSDFPDWWRPVALEGTRLVNFCPA